MTTNDDVSFVLFSVQIRNTISFVNKIYVYCTFLLLNSNGKATTKTIWPINPRKKTASKGIIVVSYRGTSTLYSK